jgi:DNA end-binding protein Ku
MRSIWKGALSFGLVNIPVHLYTGSHEKEISFVLLHKKDHSEIRYARICKTEEKEVPWSEIVKAYEYEKGDYVIMEDEDFEKANLKKTKSIEIIQFIHEDEIDSIYYVKPYYLEPDKNADKAYGLLRDALKKSKKVGLAKFVLRNREHLGVLKIHENMLVLNELRYETELLRTADLNLPEIGTSNKKEMDMAVQLIEQLTSPFEPQAYKDTYTEEIKEIIEQKSKGRLVHAKSEKPKYTKVHDIMSLLKASLDNQKKPAKKPPKKSIKTA